MKTILVLVALAAVVCLATCSPLDTEIGSQQVKGVGGDQEFINTIKHIKEWIKWVIKKL